MHPKPTLWITVNHHFDPIWRRCWKRPLYFKDLIYRSYGDLQEYAILEHLKIAQAHPGYAFDIESVVVAREFLRRHPEKLDALKMLYDEGRFAVGGSGDNIIDSNMVLGESVVRNFLYGFRWMDRTFGHLTPLVTRKDAFGQSAQLPQIIRGFGVRWVWPTYYGPGPFGNFWRGLDGSIVCIAGPPVSESMDAAPKYKPCPRCDGKGCDACGQRGIEWWRKNALPPEERIEKLFRAGGGVFTSVAEEMIPNPELVEWAQKESDRFDVRFVTSESLAALVQDKIDQVDDPPEDEVHTYAQREEGRRHPDTEINPNNTGVFATRIKLKQLLRQKEYALQSAERLATLALSGRGSYPAEDLSDAWELLLFTMFHDCVTGTMVDQAYEELMEYWPRIDKAVARVTRQALRVVGRSTQTDASITVFNPLGEAASAVFTAEIETPHEAVRLVDDEGNQVPVHDQRRTDDGRLSLVATAERVPALGTRRYRIESGAGQTVRTLPHPVIENDRFRITADNHGILEIYDKRLGRTISEAAEYRPGELILERDEGSPWATVYDNQERMRAGAMPDKGGWTLESVDASDSWQRLTFAVTHHGKFLDARRFTGNVEVTLYEHLDRVEFVTTGFWSSFNERVRVAFPVPMKGEHFYEIPYGMLKRDPYKPWFGWQASNGDWPAINWVGVQGEGASVAVMNKGLPSHRIEESDGGTLILLTPLRSPTYPTYLHEPDRYTMTDYDGMRDEGHHRFEYALTAYESSLADSSVVIDAESYNAGLLSFPGIVELPAPPVVESNTVRMTTLKQSEDGQALILRLAEFRGRGGTASVKLAPGTANASLVDLMEQEHERLEIRNDQVTIAFRPWQIMTLRLW